MCLPQDGGNQSPLEHPLSVRVFHFKMKSKETVHTGSLKMIWQPQESLCEFSFIINECHVLQSWLQYDNLLSHKSWPRGCTLNTLSYSSLYRSSFFRGLNTEGEVCSPESTWLILTKIWGVSSFKTGLPVLKVIERIHHCSVMGSPQCDAQLWQTFRHSVPGASHCHSNICVHFLIASLLSSCLKQYSKLILTSRVLLSHL